MSAQILHHPMCDRLQRDMHRVFGEQVDELREARIRREREASERKYRERYGDDFTPPEAA